VAAFGRILGPRGASPSDRRDAGDAGDAVDVRVAWGESVLYVAELAPPRRCVVGVDDGWDDGEERSVVALPAEAIGARRAELIDVDRRVGASDGATDPRSRAVDVLAPPGASVELSSPDRPSRAREELIADGTARRCDAIAGAWRVRLEPGERLRIVCGAFAFDVVRGVRSAATSRRPRLDLRSVVWTIASAAFHVALLAVFAGVVPSLAVSNDDIDIAADVALAEPAFIPVTALPEVAIPDAEAIGDAARRGSNVASQAGATGLGEPRARSVSSRYGVRGPTDNPDPHLGRDDPDGDQEVSFVEAPPKLLPMPRDRNRAPIAPWGRDDSLGNDPNDARGEMWGDEIDDAYGAGGLGLAGESECGCGSARALAPGVIGELLRIVRPVAPPSGEPAAAVVAPAAASRAVTRSR
jgi:hypothetical protein